MQRLSRDLLTDPGSLITTAVERVRSEAPDYAALLEAKSEAADQISFGLLSVLAEALGSDEALEPYEFWDTIREVGRQRCEQGLALETLLEVLSIHRRVLLDGIERRAAGSLNPGPLLLVAERRLDLAVQKLTLSLTRGYLDQTERR